VNFYVKPEAGCPAKITHHLASRIREVFVKEEKLKTHQISASPRMGTIGDVLNTVFACCRNLSTTLSHGCAAKGEPYTSCLCNVFAFVHASRAKS